MTDDRVVSPVIGVIILISLVVTLTVVIAGIVTGLGGSQPQDGIDVYGENVTAEPDASLWWGLVSYEISLSGDYTDANHVRISESVYRVDNGTVSSVRLEPGRYQMVVYDGEERIGSVTVVVYDA